MAKAITKKVEEVQGVTITIKEFVDSLFEQKAFEELSIETSKYVFTLDPKDIVDINHTKGVITFKHGDSLCTIEDFVEEKQK